MVHTSGRTGHHSHDRLIHWARFYDLGVGLLGGRRNRIRVMVADDLQLQSGDQVLDVGCGTGRLAIVFSERVGATGSVHGIDPAAEMIKLASTRARKRGVPVNFQVAFAQNLPFADGSFDAVACTLALHHVAEDDQLTAVQEMYRVLKPSGRLLIAEFYQGPGGRRRFVSRWHRHSKEDMLDKAVGLASASGFTDVASGSTNLGWLGKMTARKPEIPVAADPERSS